MVSQKKNKVKVCRKCGVVLTDKNWMEAARKNGDFICKICLRKYYQEYCKNNEGELKAYIKNNKDKIEKRRRNYRKTNRCKELSRKRNLKKMYGITPKQFDKMFKAQGGVCAICGKPETLTLKGTIRQLCVDHNHVTGKVRGLLCAGCNVKVGVLDNKLFVKKAMEYLVENDRV